LSLPTIVIGSQDVGASSFVALVWEHCLGNIDTIRLYKEGCHWQSNLNRNLTGKMSASFPVKCHLPLITSRIEFEFNVLSAPPQITPRRDFGAHIRRQNRRDSVTPYGRSNYRDVTPARSLRFRSESPLTDIHSDNDENDIQKIRKPPGEAGRVKSGGYDLQTALGWDYEFYNKFSVSLLSL
jgi:hypothetical protein